MPYGVKNETQEDVKWIERCILSVKGKHPDYSEERCIKICKAALLRDRGLAQEEKKK